MPANLHELTRIPRSSFASIRVIRRQTLSPWLSGQNDKPTDGLGCGISFIDLTCRLRLRLNRVTPRRDVSAQIRFGKWTSKCE